jgi:hypothetical protein
MTDWHAWHADYDDPSSALAARLAVVQTLIERALAGAERVLSICAGDGRDVLPLLSPSVRARLIELDPELCVRARGRAAALPHVEVVCGDAAATDGYAGLVPADVVLLCGVLGNISDGDVQRVVRALPQLCAEGGRVIWTRHRRAPDLTPAIRGWLAEAGFRELAFESPAPDSWSVGLHVSETPPQPLEPGVRLFSFVR